MSDELNDEMLSDADRYNRQIQAWKEEQLKAYKDSIETFKNHCSESNIDINDSDFQFIPTTGVIANSLGLASSLITGITKDKEGLYSCKELYDLFPKIKDNPGYLRGDIYFLMLHPAFRRGMNKEANWAPRFVDLFWDVDDKKIDSYISLDSDRVRVNVDGYSYFEYDTWYGAPYNEDISKIADGSVNLRPPSDLDKDIISHLFQGSYALDIYWSSKGAIKSFQALEFKSEAIKTCLNSSEYHPARYIHAEFDIEKGVFRHFDGAIQYYSSDEYFDRRDSNFRHNIKEESKIKAVSEKVFKFNGEIPVKMWTEFCCHFFASNPLTFEYFTGNYPKHIVKELNRIRDRNCE